MLLKHQFKNKKRIIKWEVILAFNILKIHKKEYYKWPLALFCSNLKI